MAGVRETVDKNEGWTSCQMMFLAGAATKVLPCFHGHHFIHKNILATRGSAESCELRRDEDHSGTRMLRTDTLLPLGREFTTNREAVSC